MRSRKLSMSAKAYRPSRSALARIPFRCVSARSGAFDQPEDDQQNDRANEGIDDVRDEPGAKVDVENGQQIARNDGADDADDDVADQSKTAALDHHAGKPAGNCA